MNEWTKKNRKQELIRYSQPNSAFEYVIDEDRFLSVPLLSVNVLTQRYKTNMNELKTNKHKQ